MKKIYTCIFLFVCINLFSQNSSQKELDTLELALRTQKQDTSKILTLSDLSRFYLYKDSRKGLVIAQKALVMSLKIKWKKGIGISHKNIGMHNISLGNYTLAAKHFITAETYLKAINDKFNLASLYNQLGILNANKGDFPNSLDYFFKAMHLYEIQKKDQQNFLAALYENIGTVYNFTEEYPKAIVYYQKAIVAYKKNKFKEVEIALVIVNLGTVYQKQGKLYQALEFYKKADNLLEKNATDFALGLTNSWMGSVLLDLKDYRLSIEKSTLAIGFVEKSDDQELLATTLQNIGFCYLQKGIKEQNRKEVEQAYVFLKKSETIHDKLGNQEGLIKDYLYQSLYYEFKNELKLSLDYHKKYTKAKEYVFNQKNKQSLKNLEDERTIQLNNKQIQLNKVTLKAKEKQKYFFVAGLLFLSIIGSLLFYQSRNRQKINEKLQLLNTELDEANKTKTRFFSILNHDLRSPVTNLIHFLHLQKDNPELLDEESKKRMENKTMSSAENLLTSMEDILLWSKGQMENFKPQPKVLSISTIFDDTKNHFDSEEKVGILFENPENIQINTDENYLKTIIRNLTGNAIKALDCFVPRNDIDSHATLGMTPTIIWKAWKENEKVYLSISDNGPGTTLDKFKALYDDKEVVGIKTGLGLHLIRDLAKGIDCKINVNSKVNEGTTITLKFIDSETSSE